MKTEKMDDTMRWATRCRWCGRVVLGPALVLGTLLLIGMVRPGAVAVGRFGLAVRSHTLELAVGNDRIWTDGPGSRWKLTTSGAGVSIGNGFGVRSWTLAVYFVPLWPWALLLGLGGGVLVWSARRVERPGLCATCGYDLVGLNGRAGDRRCPECDQSASPVARVIALIRGVGRVYASGHEGPRPAVRGRGGRAGSGRG